MRVVCRSLMSFGFGGLLLVGCGEKEEEERVGGRVGWVAGDWEEIGEGLEGRKLRDREGEVGNGFVRVDGSEVGVEFENLLKRENIRNYLLTGAGLTVGDVDGNGLPDLFLVSQDGGNKLFRQVAPWVFEDATSGSGLIETGAWGSGAAFVDLDNDGDLDLYLCNKGALDEVYLNRGDGTFTGSFFGGGEVKHRAPTMVAASDYDGDGDLDLYRTATRMWGLDEMFGSKLLTVRGADGEWEAHESAGGEYVVVDGLPRHMGTRDYLFRNDGTAENPIDYTDVTAEAGMVVGKEHGLAAVWWDSNNDLLPDLYVSNDFHTPDHLYQNNGRGGFEEVTGEAFPYTSWSSMGSDFADINNDGWFDYLSTDMSATSHFKQKTMMGAMTDTAWFLDNMEPRQYMRNAMQVNTGTGKFVDVAFYAGLDSTDWTWSGIFGDLDNDGWEDVFFTNGIERNVQDSDAAIRHLEAKEAGATKEELQEIFLDGPRFVERNLVFRNEGGLRFSDRSEDWGLGDETVSHGAVMVDLDRDGDLDLVVNNMNEAVGIYRNDSLGGEGMLVSLVGVESNRFGLGARVEVELEGGERLSRMVTSSRGYMSGVEAVVHFGLGEGAVKELVVRWPGGKVQRFEGVEGGRHYRVTEVGVEEDEEVVDEGGLFVAAGDGLGIDFEHEENVHDDFFKQPLLPNRLSVEGPGLALGDVNGDGRADVFCGGARGYPGGVWVWGESGYRKMDGGVFEEGVPCEDVAAVWLDVEGDGDEDLYVVSGGASRADGDDFYGDRLYLNDGEGGLVVAPEGSLPELRDSGSCVVAGDYDGDGDVDLYVGSRHVPGRYPTEPASSLLMNEGGVFKRVESVVNEAGMVTGARWGDLNGDGTLDLVVSTGGGRCGCFGMRRVVLWRGLRRRDWGSFWVVDVCGGGGCGWGWRCGFGGGELWVEYEVSGESGGSGDVVCE